MLKKSFVGMLSLVLASISSQVFSEESTAYSHNFILEGNSNYIQFEEPSKGVATAKILLDKNTLVMEILTPAYNIHGIETPSDARTEEQNAQVEKAKRAFLDSPQRYFSFQPVNACTMQSLSYQVEQVGLGTKQSEPQTTNWHLYDIRAEMIFDCQSVSPERMNVEVFKAFPKLQEIHAQLIANGGDLRRIKLTPETPVIEFTRSSTTK